VTLGNLPESLRGVCPAGDRICAAAGARATPDTSQERPDERDSLDRDSASAARQAVRPVNGVVPAAPNVVAGTPIVFRRAMNRFACGAFVYAA